MPTERLETQFTGAMFEIYRRAKREVDYTASRFHQMVSENGGLATALQLIHDPHPSEGYTALWERKRLDLTVEAMILDPKWDELFSDNDRNAAKARLKKYEDDFGDRS